MTQRAYRRPPWWLRAIGNRMAPRFRPDMVATLSVPGRATGQLQTTPVVVLDHDGERYLVSPFGETDWARNLRAARTGRLSLSGRDEEFIAVEVAPAERPPLIDAYLRRYGKMPQVAASFRKLPDPGDHPTFRLASPRVGLKTRWLTACGSGRRARP